MAISETRMKAEDIQPKYKHRKTSSSRQQGNRRYHTSPALCTPITPFPDDRLHSLHNGLSMGRKTAKIAPSPWDFVTLPEEDRATAIGNMHKKFGTDRACGSQARGQTDRPTSTHTNVLITILRQRSHGKRRPNYRLRLL